MVVANNLVTQFRSIYGRLREKKLFFRGARPEGSGAFPSRIFGAFPGLVFDARTRFWNCSHFAPTLWNWYWRFMRKPNRPLFQIPTFSFSPENCRGDRIKKGCENFDRATSCESFRAGPYSISSIQPFKKNGAPKKGRIQKPEGTIGE